RVRERQGPPRVDAVGVSGKSVGSEEQARLARVVVGVAEVREQNQASGGRQSPNRRRRVRGLERPLCRRGADGERDRERQRRGGEAGRGSEEWHGSTVAPKQAIPNVRSGSPEAQAPAETLTKASSCSR